MYIPILTLEFSILLTSVKYALTNIEQFSITKNFSDDNNWKKNGKIGWSCTRQWGRLQSIFKVRTKSIENYLWKCYFLLWNCGYFLKMNFRHSCTTLISKRMAGILRLLGLNKFILTSDKVVLVNLKCDLIFLNETKVSMIGDWWFSKY